MPMRILPRRFWSKVRKNGPLPKHRPELGRCWRWLGKINSQGQSCFWMDGRDQLAYRVAYTFLKGPIPQGLTLDHLCRNRECPNPNHTEPVTLRENIRRGMAPSGLNSRKTRCKYGHPLSGSNLVVVQGRSGSQRQCLICTRRRRIEWRHRMGINKQYYRVKTPVDVSRGGR